MKKIDKFPAIVGSIGLLAGIILILDGQTFIGISGSIVSGMLALKGFGYLDNDNHTD